MSRVKREEELCIEEQGASEEGEIFSGPSTGELSAVSQNAVQPEVEWRAGVVQGLPRGGGSGVGVFLQAREGEVAVTGERGTRVQSQSEDKGRGKEGFKARVEHSISP